MVEAVVEAVLVFFVVVSVTAAGLLVEAVLVLAVEVTGLLVLLSELLVEGVFDVSADELSLLSVDESSLLSEELSELVFSEDELFADDVTDSDELSDRETDSAEDTDAELSVDELLLSVLQPQADIITAAHSISEIIRFFIFYVSFCLW